MSKIQDFLTKRLPETLITSYDDFFSTKEKRNLIVAVSGWADSVYVLVSLLAYLEQYSQVHQHRVIVVHCNHRTRNETDEEEEAIKLFLNNTLPLYLFRYRKDDKSESAMRQRRRQCFSDVVSQESHADFTSCVITGHHLDDRIETSLLNLNRWCGLWGLANMSRLQQWIFVQRDKYYQIFRPLITFTKKDILLEIKKHLIPYATDPTNFDYRWWERSVVRHFVSTPASLRCRERYWTRTKLYADIQRHKNSIKDSYQLFPLKRSEYWTVWWGYQLQIDWWCSIDILVSLLHELGSYKHVSSGWLRDLMEFLETGDSWYKMCSWVMFVVSHGKVYVFGAGKITENDKPFRESKPIAKTISITSMGTYTLGDVSFVVDDENELWSEARFPQEWDSFHGKRLKKYLLNQKIPLFWRNYLVVLEKEWKIIRILQPEYV